jgi:aspartyl protease family protein
VISLHADIRGHYFAPGNINGSPVRLLVDTGASMVSIGNSDARRAGIDFRKGEPMVSQTANGSAQVWRVKLDSVRLGDITMHGVDGVVHENDLPFVLLGMSFLKRMDMQREGDRLILRKRY